MGVTIIKNDSEDEPISLNLGYAPTKTSKHVQPMHSTPNSPSAPPTPEPLQQKVKPKRSNAGEPQIRTQPTAKPGKPGRQYAPEQLDSVIEPLLPAEQDPRVPGPTGRIRSTKEGVEFRRKQVLRLVLRGVPKQTIAEHLGVSIYSVYDDVKELTREMRQELRAFDYPGYIGMSLAFYDECRNIALRLATDNNEKSNGVKMQALRTAVAAEDSKHTFLTRIGLHKVTTPTDPFNSIQTGRSGSYSDENDIQSFMQLIAQATKGQTVDATSRVVDEPRQP
jgi:hypothetical protein